MDNSNTRPTCEICCFTFNQIDRCPKVLRCGHTFCLDCLNQLPVEKKKISCPGCRSSQGVPRRGIESLPTNYTLLTLLQTDKRPEDNTFNNNADDGMVVCTHTLTEEVSVKIPYNMFKQDSFYFPRMNPQGGTPSATPRRPPEEPTPFSLPSIGGGGAGKVDKMQKDEFDEEVDDLGNEKAPPVRLPSIESKSSDAESTPKTARKADQEQHSIDEKDNTNLKKRSKRKKEDKAAEEELHKDNVGEDTDTPLAVEDINDDDEEEDLNERRGSVVLIQERKTRETIRLPPVAGVGMDDVCGMANRMFGRPESGEQGT